MTIQKMELRVKSYYFFHLIFNHHILFKFQIYDFDIIVVMMMISNDMIFFLFTFLIIFKVSKKTHIS